MNSPVAMILQELETFGRDHDVKELDHARKLLNLERDTAELVRTLVLCSQRKRILEVGTSNGYSSIYLASTLREIQYASPLTTIERNTSKAALAKENFERARLADFIDLRIGSATEVIKELTGPFDCIFFDADRISAAEQLRLLLPKLSSDVLLLTDNVRSHPTEVAEYIRAFDRLPDFTTSIIQIGKGLHIAYRQQKQKSMTIWV
jgi:predicted O-methyltransferase YrrM